MATIIELIREISGTPTNAIQITLGTVTSVDKEKWICVVAPINKTQMEFPFVHLQIDPEVVCGFMIVPKVGSTVVVGHTNNFAFILSYSEIESIQLGGKENLCGLIDVKKLTDQIDEVQKNIQTIVDAIKKAVPASGASDGGAALQTSIIGLLSGIAKIKFDDIVNSKITHGS